MFNYNNSYFIALFWTRGCAPGIEFKGGIIKNKLIPRLELRLTSLKTIRSHANLL